MFYNEWVNCRTALRGYSNECQLKDQQGCVDVGSYELSLQLQPHEAWHSQVWENLQQIETIRRIGLNASLKHNDRAGSAHAIICPSAPSRGFTSPTVCHLQDQHSLVLSLHNSIPTPLSWALTYYTICCCFLCLPQNPRLHRVNLIQRQEGNMWSSCYVYVDSSIFFFLIVKNNFYDQFMRNLFLNLF